MLFRSFLPGEREKSVHLAVFPSANPERVDNELAGYWKSLLDVRADVLKALELKRAEKLIGHPLDAAVSIVPTADFAELLHAAADRLATIFIVSRVELVDSIDGDAFEGVAVPGLKIAVSKAPGAKCERCWCYSEELGTDPEHPAICPKCTAAVG